MVDFEHGFEGYRKFGCRCKVCKAGNTNYMREYRAQRRGFDQPPKPDDESEASVTRLLQPAPVVDVEPGPVEQGVIDRSTTGDLAAAAQRMPDLYAACRSLARILDDSRQITTQPSAMRQLMAGIGRLEAAAAFTRRGRLADVARLSQRRSPTSGVG